MTIALFTSILKTINLWKNLLIWIDIAKKKWDNLWKYN